MTHTITDRVLVLHEQFPVKVHVFDSFQAGGKSVEPLVAQALRRFPQISRLHDFAVGFAYSFPSVGATLDGLDLHVARLQCWEADPFMYDHFTVEHGALSPAQTCEASYRVLMQEMELRRQCVREAYLKSWPEESLARLAKRT